MLTKDAHIKLVKPVTITSLVSIVLIWYFPSALCGVNKFWFRFGGIAVPFMLPSRGVDICKMRVLSVDGTADNRPVYGKDNEKVWINFGGDTGKITIKHADPKTFVLLHRCIGYRSCYAKDKEHIFYGYKIIEGADVSSFKVLDYQHAQDRNRKYFKENSDGDI